MRFVSLFTGIGGMDLGLERAGWECVAQVEWDDYCTKILEKHWPAVPRWKDIHDVDPEDFPDTDAVVGGFPCQPVSLAGNRLAQDDERWLWPEFLRIVRHVRPRIVVVENVPGLASAGMGDVLGDLAACGYDAEWQSIPAAAVGAPHLRWRFFIVAYPRMGRRREVIHESHYVETRSATVHRDGSDSAIGVGVPRVATRGSDIGCHETENVAYSVSAGSRRQRRMASNPGDEGRGTSETGRTPIQPGDREAHTDGLVAGGTNVADTDASGRDGRAGKQRPAGRREPTNSSGLPDTIIERPQGIKQVGATERTVDRPGDGRHPGWWTVEPDVGRVAHGIPARVDRLKGLGNAVVPQAAEWVGNIINQGRMI